MTGDEANVGATAKQLFRGEAIAHRARSNVESHVLALSPRWTRWTYWVLAWLLAAGLCYAAVGTIDDYATGPALVRFENRRNIIARSPGTVAEVRAQPGQRVEAGDILLRLHEAEESAELERLQREFELTLVKLLREPADQTARAALTSLHAARQLAQARLEERVIRAPRAGTVGDVRVRNGQELAPGAVLLSLIDEAAPGVVMALLPGHFRPQLRLGMPLRLELEGYRYAYRELVVSAIADELVGPAELKRYLGAEFADAIDFEGPRILVRAALPSRTFRARGVDYPYFDGMRAIADVRVRDESLLVTLVPGLRALFEASDG